MRMSILVLTLASALLLRGYGPTANAGNPRVDLAPYLAVFVAPHDAAECPNLAGKYTCYHPKRQKTYSGTFDQTTDAAGVTTYNFSLRKGRFSPGIADAKHRDFLYGGSGGPRQDGLKTNICTDNTLIVRMWGERSRVDMIYSLEGADGFNQDVERAWIDGRGVISRGRTLSCTRIKSLLPPPPSTPSECPNLAGKYQCDRPKVGNREAKTYTREMGQTTDAGGMTTYWNKNEGIEKLTMIADGQTRSHRTNRQIRSACADNALHTRFTGFRGDAEEYQDITYSFDGDKGINVDHVRGYGSSISWKFRESCKRLNQ